MKPKKNKKPSYEPYPENIFIVSKPAQTVTLKNNEKRTGRQAFAVGSKNIKLREQAIKWATNTTSTQVEQPNTPIEIYVIGREWRVNNLVYKVLSSDGYIYDLREHIFFSALGYGIDSSGKILTQFIWSQSGAQMYLVQKDKQNEEMIKNIIL